MMKRITTISLLLICALSIWAQSISVSSFRLLETDLTANNRETMARDQNGEVAALIKVVTTQTGFRFDTGQLGVVKTVQKPAEIWVYVPRGVNKISISHPQFGILRDYFLPMAVIAARTYELVLVTGASDSSQTQMDGHGGVDINSSPAMSDIYIDGEKVGQTPQSISELDAGQHELRITKQGFKDYISTITIKEGETVKHSANLEEIEMEKLSNAIEIITVNNVSFAMVRVEGGTFKMGGASKKRSDFEIYESPKIYEDPVHNVILSSYYIGETEVTQALWEAIMGGSNPSEFEGVNRPVENVTWDDCWEFIRRLNHKTGRKFRLPTEAEWEFAARGGNKSHGYTYSGSNSLKRVAWCSNNSKETHPVKEKQANELGLYDMSGNVMEWCMDKYGGYRRSDQANPTCAITGAHRVIRGGSWTNLEDGCRVTDRRNASEIHQRNNLGLRLVLQ